jgi:hypothetical protein
VKPKTIPKTKVDKPKTFNWTKSQKALYRELTIEAQKDAQQAAGIVLQAHNKNLARAIDDFAEELGIIDDGHDYDTDVQKFRFVRRDPNAAPEAPRQ